MRSASGRRGCAADAQHPEALILRACERIVVGKGAPCAVPTTDAIAILNGGHASLCPPYGCGYISALILRSAPRARLEGWPRVLALLPSFETRASTAPQDEGARRSVTRAQHPTSSARWLR